MLSDRKLKNKKLIVLTGLPFTGKTKLGRILEKKLKIKFVDIDEIRYGLFKNSPKEMKSDQDKNQMAISYDSIFWITNFILKHNDDLVIAATFSRKENQEKIIEICRKNNAILKFIYCYASDQIIQKRILKREKKKESRSTCRTWEHYERDKLRYYIFPGQKLSVDTSRPINDCLKDIIDYILF